MLRAVQTVIDEDMAFPILIGRPDVIDARIERLGLRMRPGVDFELTNINDDPRFNDYWQQYHALTERRGVTPAAAKNLMRSRPTLIARADGRARRSRRDDLRPRRPLPQEAGLPAQRVRARPGRDQHVGDDGRDQRTGRVVLPRHARAGGSRRPSRSPRARCRRATASSCSASNRRSRCCRTPTSAATTTRARARCARCARS